MVFLLALFLVISVLAKRLAGKSVSDMTYIVSSAWDVKPQLNQSVNQSMAAELKSKWRKCLSAAASKAVDVAEAAVTQSGISTSLSLYATVHGKELS